MTRIEIPNFSVDNILAGCRKIIIEEGLPVVQDALDRRQGRIRQFVSMVQKDLEEKRECELELQQLSDSVEQLQQSNIIKEAQVVKLTKEIDQLKMMTKLDEQEKKLAKITQQKARMLSRLESLQRETRLYDEFQEHVGLLYLGRQEENTILLASTKIHPKYPEDQYLLYFSKFDLSNDNINFQVESADPTFDEFEEIAKKFNESQSLTELIDEVQSCWRSAACKEGLPRLATPKEGSCSTTKRPRISSTAA